MPERMVSPTAIDRELRALRRRDAASLRAVRRRFSKALTDAPGTDVLELACRLFERFGHRFVACELVNQHPGAAAAVRESHLRRLGKGLDGWGSVDVFGTLVSGPAWREKQVSEAVVHAWTRSPDRWWRRTALVSTVALNVKARGGRGDARRTLAVCAKLVDDHDDMVEKALSWALRSLVPHDARAVREFLVNHDALLGARVKRELRNKLQTGLKNPKMQDRGRS